MLLLLLSGRAPGGVIAEAQPSTILDVRVDRGELTVHVRDASLGQVLTTIGERAGIEVTLRGDFGDPVTQSFAGVPLEEGIRRLARGHSLAVTYAGEPPSRVLTRIWVMNDPSTVVSSTPPASAREGVGTPRDQRDDEGTGWIGGIQALAEEADRGSETAVAHLTDLGASEPSAAVREQAVAALARLTGVATEPALTAALADADASVRVRAVRGLRGTGTDTAIQSLAGIAIGDADPQVRLAALRALVSLSGRTAFLGLQNASSDADDLVRDTATRALSWWNTRLPGASQ